MRKTLIAACVALLAGCAMTPQELAARSTGSLCVSYARAILNPNRGAWLDEVYRRGETCAPYAAEMELAGRESQQNLNSINSQYAAPLVSRPARPAGVTAFLSRHYVQGTSRVCVYDALGSPHIITLRSVDLCPMTAQAQR